MSYDLCAASKDVRDPLADKPALSVVIVACDEERTIGDVLASVQPLAREIILVDSGSSDRTMEIAALYGARIYHQDWLGYAAQKNYAMSLAACDWVLSLDADEVLTPDLVSEMRVVLASDGCTEYSGFKIPRTLFIGDRAVAHGGFYPDAQLRLIRRGAGKFNDRLVHERIFVEGKVATFKHGMNHYSYGDVAAFTVAMDKYAQLSAKEAQRRGYTPWQASFLNELVHPLWTFFYRYILRAGFLDGILGLKLNLIYADYVRRKIRYLRRPVH